MQVIQVLGVNHRQARVTAREQILASRPAATLVDEARRVLRFSECVLLTTCNRIELYYVAPPDAASAEAAKALLCGTDGAACLTQDQVDHFVGADAVRHLFEVSSGLDSMVLGEYEILGQVRSSLAQAVSNGWSGLVLQRLCEHALRAGKRARRETAISSGIFSVGQCAVRMAQEVLGSLEGRRLLVFGAGRIARVTAKHLASAGVGPITVFSRTFERAQELACTAGGTAITAQQLPAALQESDIVVGCASAPHYVIAPADLEATVHSRRDRPLVLIDLGVPRNVDPAVSELPGVHLFNIDDLERVVAEHAGEREREVQRVRVIAGQEACEFDQWLGERSVAELISDLYAKAETARQECLGLAARKLSDDDLATAAYLLDLLARKLLHDPISAIRGAAVAEGADGDLLSAAKQLFGLAPGNGAEVDAQSDSPVAEVVAVDRNAAVRGTTQEGG